MNEIDLNRLDLNLLKSFRALLMERHVGRAAQRMHVTQSAMSHTLARLRDAFDDPLFVRTAKGIEPTTRALELSGPLDLILSEIGKLVAPRVFAPERINTRFRIETHDFIAATYLPKVLLSLQSRAPDLVFDIQIIGATCYERLDNGELDLIIGAGLKANPRFKQKRLVDEELVCLVDKKHPVLKNWHAESLFRYPHIRMSLLDDRDDPVSRYASKQGFPQRKIGMYTETLQLQPAVLTGTQLISFLPRSLAQQGANFYGLKLQPCPFELPKLAIKSIWHERSQHDPTHKWIREHIANSFQGLDILLDS